ncbi:MAG TPA: tetratricopeptide repeat protein [bacterium]|nr:tetratricopeptide repeat protein [bacterium]
MPALLAAAPAADRPAEDLLAAADELRLKGAHEDALQLYEQVLLDDPTSARGWSGAALSLEAVDEERAVSILAEAMSEPTSSLPVTALAILADGWARRGAERKARELSAADREGASGRYFLVQGRIYLAERDFPAAIKKFKKAHAAGEAAAPYFLGETLLETGHYDEAALHLDRFLEVFPYVAEARCARAEVYCRKGEYDRAEAELAEALTYEPTNKRALLDLAALAARARDYGRAIRLFGEVTRLDPGDEHAFRGIVEAYERVDPLVAAQKLEEYRRRFEIAP